jgi:SAP domain
LYKPASFFCSYSSAPSKISMPRTKRTLVEADPNASAPAPASRKASPSVASGKDNQNYRVKTVAELAKMLEDRGLPHTGKKAELVQRLDETSKTISRAGEAVKAGKSQQADEVSEESKRWDNC